MRDSLAAQLFACELAYLVMALSTTQGQKETSSCSSPNMPPSLTLCGTPGHNVALHGAVMGIWYFLVYEETQIVVMAHTKIQFHYGLNWEKESLDSLNICVIHEADRKGVRVVSPCLLNQAQVPRSLVCRDSARDPPLRCWSLMVRLQVHGLRAMQI